MSYSKVQNADSLEDIYIPLPGIVSTKYYENWNKCVMALNLTRKALRKPIESGSIKHLKDMSKDQILHIDTFIKCIENNKITHLYTKRKKIEWSCSHVLCGTLLNDLLENHEKSPKRNWQIEINSDATEKKEESKVSDWENGANEAGDEEKTKESGENKSDNLTHHQSHNIEVNIDNHLWDVMKLFTYTDTEEDDYACEELEKLEFVLMMKLIKDCKFLSFDGFIVLFEKVRKVRNNVMHSADYSVKDETLVKYLKDLIDLLENYKEFRVCLIAIKTLKNLEEEALFKLSRSHDDLTELLLKGLKHKRNAIQFDITIAKDGAKAELRSLLYSTCEQMKAIDSMPSQVLELQREKKDMETRMDKLKEQVRERDKTIEELKGPFQRFGKGVDSAFGWFS